MPSICNQGKAVLNPLLIYTNISDKPNLSFAAEPSFEVWGDGKNKKTLPLSRTSVTELGERTHRRGVWLAARTGPDQTDSSRS